MPMVTKNFILFCVVIIINSITISVSQDIWSPTCDENANFTRNGTYQRNLDDALSSLTSDTSIRYGFYNWSVGETPNQVNAIGLCRGDMEPDDCRKCINESIPKLRQVCPNQKGAIGWYDDCMLRYSNVSFLGILDTQYAGGIANGRNTSNVDQFNQALDQLLDQLRAEASSGGSLRKYASNNMNGPGFVTIYGLMQCTPDLSELDCYNCLDNAIRLIPNCCYGRSGLQFYYPSCNIRYEEYRFFGNAVVIAPLSPPPSPPPSPLPSQSSPSPPSPPPGMYILTIAGHRYYSDKL